METKIKKQRIIGLDLLRIIAMLMIVTMHYLGNGNFLNSEENGNFNIIANIMESLSIVAVNCFVLITGCFLANSIFSWKKVFKLWGETLFYSISIYLVLIITGVHEFSIKEAVKSFLPVITREYWFINVYLLMYILSPFLNILINHLKKEELKRLIIILLFAFCIMPSCLPGSMNFDTTGGYGIIWFIVIYMVAAWIRLYDINIKSLKIKRKYYLLFYLVLSLIIASLRITFKVNIMYNSNFILVFFASIFLFLYFKDLKIRLERISNIIVYISSLTFGVYLIHTQKILSEFVLYNQILHTKMWLNSWFGLFISVFLIIGSFIIYLLIESFRQKILIYIKNKFLNGKVENDI